MNVSLTSGKDTKRSGEAPGRVFVGTVNRFAVFARSSGTETIDATRESIGSRLAAPRSHRRQEFG